MVHVGALTVLLLLSMTLLAALVGVLSRAASRQRALRQHAALLDLTRDMVLVRDTGDVITYWNRGAEETYGWSRSEAIGRRSRELLQPVFAMPVEDIDAELRRTGHWEGEVLHKRRDGSVLPVASRWALQRDAHGRPGAVLETNNDITERRLAEQTRQDLEELSRAAFASNPAMYFIVDAAGTVVSVNEYGADQLGYEPHELIGQPVLNVFIQADRERVSRNAESCFQNLGQRLRWEACKIRKDGTMLWVRETANAVLLKKQPVLLIVCEDITERKRAEQALRQSEKELRDLIESLPAMAWTTLADGTNVFVSRHWTEYTGLSGRATAGEGWQAAFHPDDIGRYVASWRVSLANGVPFENEARLRRAADGQYRWFLVRAIPVRDEQGLLVKWYGVLADIEDHKRSEQALRQSEAYLADAQRLAHTGSWAIHAASGRTTHWSEEMFRIHGIDPEGGSPPDRRTFLARIVHPDDRARLRDLMHRAARAKADFAHDYRIALPDGATRHAHAIGHPVLDAAGKLLEYVGSVVDVTERKRAEEQHAAHLWFLESMDRLNRAMQANNDLQRMMSDVLDAVVEIFACDRAWLVYPCDPQARSWRTVMEHTRQEIAGVGAIETDLPVDAGLADMYARARASSAAVLFGPGHELPVPEAIAERYGVRSQMAMAVYPKVDQPYLFALHQSVGARNWTAQEQRLFQEIGRRLADSLTGLLMLRILRESEARFRTFVDFAADAFYLHDEDGSVLDVNQQACVSLGYRRDELIGMCPDNFDPEVVLPQVMERLRGAEIVTFESRHRRKNGTLFPVEVRLRAFGQAGRRLFVSLVRDITERKDAEAARAHLESELRRAQKMEAIGTLASGIAHDFNNILGAILGFGELAQEKAGDGRPIDDELDEVMRAGQRGKRLVEHIVAFSRSGTGERLPVHVQSVVEEALALLAASLPKDVRLEQRLAAGDAAIVGDATQLHQVAINLCTNAVQAMPRGGVLTVTLDRMGVPEQRAVSHGMLERGPHVRLEVSDTGTGIAQAALDRIFDPFFTTKGVGKGTGLGLSLVHGIVVEYRGAIDVATREGAGTTFTVWLPSSGDIELPLPDASDELPRGNGESVMIVDDERPLVRLAEETLARLGYDPAGFDSSVAALEAFRAEPQRYDLVLTDATMPDLTGTDLAREIRRLRADLPIVLMSGYEGPQLAAYAGAVGVSDILHKPLGSRDLAQALARALARAREGDGTAFAS